MRVVLIGSSEAEAPVVGEAAGFKAAQNADRGIEMHGTQQCVQGTMRKVGQKTHTEEEDLLHPPHVDSGVCVFHF